MSELDDFLADILPRQISAEAAMHTGDPAPRLALWSQHEPVTLLGARVPHTRGRDEVSRISRWAASRFSGGTDYDLELLAAGVSGDLAYTVGLERCTVSIDRGPVVANLLRVTHVYRREDGVWKIVHRHADVPPADLSPPP